MDNKSSIKWLVMMFFDAVAIAFGIFFIYCSWYANAGVDAELTSIVKGHFSSQETPRLGHFIAGILSGGSLTVVPIWQVRTGFVVGSILCYVGIAGLFLHSRKKKLRVIFTRRYWTSVYITFDDA
jgi:hypothetical protein